MDFFRKNTMDSSNGHGSIPLFSWDKVCRTHCEWGLGFRKLQDINMTLLAKLGRKVITNSHYVCVKVVSTKYLTEGGKKAANASTM